jgi:hypothetical protein
VLIVGAVGACVCLIGDRSFGPYLGDENEQFICPGFLSKGFYSALGLCLGGTAELVVSSERSSSSAQSIQNVFFARTSAVEQGDGGLSTRGLWRKEKRRAGRILSPPTKFPLLFLPLTLTFRFEASTPHPPIFELHLRSQSR